MCKRCEEREIDRRSLLALAGFGMAAASFGLGVRPAIAADGKKTALTPDQALAALKEGNARYVSNPQACVMDLAKRRADVANSQAPWATIVGCSDSRVPPELLFGGLGLGELFVARNAGNMVDTATMGTVEYGAEHLGAPLIVVLGHERCGAVVAACDVVDQEHQAARARSARWSSRSCRPQWPCGQARRFRRQHRARERQADGARLATASPILSHLVKDGKLKVVAARYDLDDGKVEYLS